MGKGSHTRTHTHTYTDKHGLGGGREEKNKQDFFYQRKSLSLHGLLFRLAFPPVLLSRTPTLGALSLSGEKRTNPTGQGSSPNLGSVLSRGRHGIYERGSILTI